MPSLSIYLHQKPLDAQLPSLLAEVFPDASIRLIESNILRIEPKTIKENETSLTDLHTMLITEFSEKVTLLSIHASTRHILSEKRVMDIIITMPHKAYTMASGLLYIIKHHPEAIKILQKGFVDSLGYPLIETALAFADADMNITTTSKNHYLHRNTLHYRIDRIEALTGLNIKTFEGLLVFALLYRY